MASNQVETAVRSREIHPSIYLFIYLPNYPPMYLSIYSRMSSAREGHMPVFANLVFSL